MARIKIKKNKLNEIIRLLAEELITIQRGGRELVYDAQFASDDSVIHAIPYNYGGYKRSNLIALGDDPYSKFQLEPDNHFEKIVHETSQLTTTPKHEIINKINELSLSNVKCRILFTDIKSAVNHLNVHWINPIWPGKGGQGSNTTGRGEANLYLAFHSRFRGEPDFVPLSVNGDILGKFSVKFFGLGGAGSVRSKTRNLKYADIRNSIINRFGNTLSQSSLKAINSNLNYESLMAALKDFLASRPSKQSIENLNTDLVYYLDEMKKEFLSENESSGVIAVTNKFDFINANEINMIEIINLKDTRVQVKLATGVERDKSLSEALKILS